MMVVESATAMEATDKLSGSWTCYPGPGRRRRNITRPGSDLDRLSATGAVVDRALQRKVDTVDRLEIQHRDIWGKSDGFVGRNNGGRILSSRH